MAWTYSGDPSNSLLDQYRFKLSDTDPDDPVLQDGEITYLINSYADEDLRLYHMFDAAATMYAREATKSRLGPQSEDTTDRLKFFQTKATFYRTRVTYMGVSLSSLTFDPNTGKPCKDFRRGMMDYVQYS